MIGTVDKVSDRNYSELAEKFYAGGVINGKNVGCVNEVKSSWVLKMQGGGYEVK